MVLSVGWQYLNMFLNSPNEIKKCKNDIKFKSLSLNTTFSNVEIALKIVYYLIYINE